jgi:3-deoxy-D-manno-octulosonic-acid transferase
LQHFDACYAQNQESADRLIALGAPTVRMNGNLKNSVAALPVDYKLQEQLKRLGKAPIFFAASTHQGEESILFDAYKNLLPNFPTLILWLAPRHPERASRLKEQAQKDGFKTATLTEFLEDESVSCQVLIIDRIGVLGTFFKNCHMVFMGGSLIPHGGQNLIEPAKFAKPIMYGQHMHNFKDISEALIEAGAVVVRDADEVRNQASAWLKSAETRFAIGQTINRRVQNISDPVASILHQCGSRVN